MIKGVHFVQEDSPDEIGSAFAAWMKTSADWHIYGRPSTIAGIDGALR